MKAGIGQKIQQNNVQMEIDFNKIFNPREMFSELSSPGERQQYFKKNFGFLVSNLFLLINVCMTTFIHTEVKTSNKNKYSV